METSYVNIFRLSPVLLNRLHICYKIHDTLKNVKPTSNNCNLLAYENADDKLWRHTRVSSASAESLTCCKINEDLKDRFNTPY